MAFATTDDVGLRLGRELTASEEASIELLLDGAAASIAVAAGRTEAQLEALSPVPAVLRFLSIEIVCRALANPNSLQSLNEQVGSYTYGARFRADAGLTLNAIEEQMVRRAVNPAGTGSVRVDSIVDEILDITYGS